MADLVGVHGQRKEFKVVGKPNLPGKLSYAMATGIAKFGSDYVVPDMLHAKFLRSPYASARIISVDTTKAREIPGVVDIVTWEDEDIKNLSSGGDRFMMGPPQPFLDNIADQEGAYDKKTGVKLNTNMFEYKKPTILDRAPVDMDLLETRAGNAAYGDNGISHSLANTHLVITAIYNAIGKWVDPPATPDKVLRALGKA